MIDADSLKTTFQGALKAYRESVISSFYAKQGEDDTALMATTKGRVVEIHSDCPNELKPSQLLMVEVVFAERVLPRYNSQSLYDPAESAARLNDWLKKLGEKLAAELLVRVGKAPWAP